MSDLVCGFRGSSRTQPEVRYDWITIGIGSASTSCLRCADGPEGRLKTAVFLVDANRSKVLERTSLLLLLLGHVVYQVVC